MRESQVIKKWQEQARKEERLAASTEAVIAVLSAKFGVLPSDLPAHVQSIQDTEILRQLLLQAVRAGSIDDFRKQLPNASPNGSANNER